jgi:hypothetical protein
VTTTDKNNSSSSIIHKKLLIGQKIIKLLHKNINGFRLSNEFRAQNNCNQNNDNIFNSTTTATANQDMNVTVASQAEPLVPMKKDLSLTYGEIVPASFATILSLIQSMAGPALATTAATLEFVDLGCGTGECMRSELVSDFLTVGNGRVRESEGG